VIQPPSYLLDTHALFWHLTGVRKLPAAVRAVFEKAAAGQAILIVSHVVLAELFYVMQKHSQPHAFSATLSRLQASQAYRIEPLTVDDLAKLPEFTDIPEMHDRLIAVQGARLGAVLVTKDGALQKSTHVDWLWAKAKRQL